MNRFVTAHPFWLFVLGWLGKPAHKVLGAHDGQQFGQALAGALEEQAGVVTSESCPDADDHRQAYGVDGFEVADLSYDSAVLIETEAGGLFQFLGDAIVDMAVQDEPGVVVLADDGDVATQVVAAGKRGHRAQMPEAVLVVSSHEGVSIPGA